MCQGLFAGRSEEYVVWVYGEDTIRRFTRALMDPFTNEPILNMQGITEAVSKYYFRNGESCDGISVAPEYQERFERLADEAIGYYDG